MRIDWSVPIWPIIVALVTVLGFSYKIIGMLNQILAIFREYPPHKHINGHVLFPKGMSPDKWS